MGLAQSKVRVDIPADRRVLHISGSPGTGKTTIGKKIKEILGENATVIETDDLITHDSEVGKKLIELEKGEDHVYYEYWESKFTELIAEEIRQWLKGKSVFLIFVGILHHWGGPRAIPVEIPAECDKIFINLSLRELLKQYYKRAAEQTENDYWSNVANGNYFISGSDEIRRGYKSDLDWHIKHGYTTVDRDDAVAYIKNLYTTKKSRTKRSVK